jgi:hypothetical protein
MEINHAHRDRRLAALGLVALAGAADVGLFIATQPAVALKTPGRAAGSLGGLLAWLLLAGLAAHRWDHERSRSEATLTLGLALVVALYGVGLALVHVVAHVGGLRTAVGAVAGIAALALAWVSRQARPD